MTNITKETFDASFSIPLNWSVLSLKGNKKHLIKGFAATTDIDDVNDQFQQEALDDIYNQITIDKPITLDIEHLDWQDNGKVLRKPKSTLPIFKVVSKDRQPNKIEITAELNENHPDSEKIWNSIKQKFLHSFSVSGYIKESINKFVDGKAINGILKYVLNNITLTGNPINKQATFTPVLKSAIHNYYLKNSNQKGGNKMENKEEVDYKKKYEDLKAEVDKMKKDKDKTQDNDDNKACKTDTKPSNKSEILNLKKEIVDLKSKLESLEQEKSSLKAKVEETKNNKDLNNEISSLKAKIEKLEKIPNLKSVVNTDQVNNQNGIKYFSINV